MMAKVCYAQAKDHLLRGIILPNISSLSSYILTRINWGRTGGSLAAVRRDSNRVATPANIARYSGQCVRCENNA